MKKIISVLLVAILVFSLVACNGSSNVSSSDSSNENQAISENSETLTVWCWDPAFNIYAMEEAAEVYKKTNSKFKLNIVETPWQDLQTKMITAATSNNYETLPDILLCQDNAFQKNVISYPEMFVDLTDSSIKFEDFGSAKVAYSVVEGKNYGVPFDNGAVVSCLRTDIIEQAGYTIDDFTDITWRQYIEKGKKVLEKTGKPMLSMQAGESDLIMMMLQSAGSSLFDAKGNPYIINNDVLKEVLSVYAELVNSGVLTQVNDWNQYIGTLTGETVVGTINGCWILASIQTVDDQAGKWAITNMPKLDGISNSTNYSNNGGSSWAVTANCKNIDLAKDFLSKTFASSVELYETILPKSGALATYIPAGNSDVYKEPQTFFDGKAIYATITDFASKIPPNNTGIYYYEARDAVANALTNIIAGGDFKSELKTAEDTIKFNMGQ